MVWTLGTGSSSSVITWALKIISTNIQYSSMTSLMKQIKCIQIDFTSNCEFISGLEISWIAVGSLREGFLCHIDRQFYTGSRMSVRRNTLRTSAFSPGGISLFYFLSSILWYQHEDKAPFQQSLEFAENGAKKKKEYSQQQFCWQKCIVNERGQRRKARLVEADRKVTVMQITTHYNSGMQKCISEHTTCQTSKWLGYSSSKQSNRNKSRIKSTFFVPLRIVRRKNLW